MEPHTLNRHFFVVPPFGQTVFIVLDNGYYMP